PPEAPGWAPPGAPGWTPPGPQSGAGPGAGQAQGGQSAGESAARATAVLVPVVLLTLLASAPPVLLLYQTGFEGSGVSASGVIGGTLMLIGLPMLAAGLYPMLSGRPPAGSPQRLNGWQLASRPPSVYLMVGLVLLVAAALAAG
ncbi:MAG: hypothetical protein ACRDT1_07310, partial [Micromonosporaceae bacterium]